MSRRDNSKTVYTTEAGRMCPNCGQPISSCNCRQRKASNQQGDGIVRITLDRKGRGGKVVTVISGLSGTGHELRELISELKRYCGTGGTLKDNNVEIQGDHREVLIQYLNSKGIRNIKRVGGD